MASIYCISYSDFGFLLTEFEYDITIRKISDFVYEDLLSHGDIQIIRRFASLPNLFDDDHSEPCLPEDTERFLMKYKGKDVKVIGSYEFSTIEKDHIKDPLGFIEVDDCSFDSIDPENLAEDVVILASCGVDLNDISIAKA